jgi:hypothetical protein
MTNILFKKLTLEESALLKNLTPQINGVLSDATICARFNVLDLACTSR